MSKDAAGPVTSDWSTTVDLVFPSHVNPMGSMFGGRVLELMDINAGISCFRFSNSYAVTASIEPIHFQNPIHVGEVISVRSRVVWTGRTSMIVRSEVHGENPLTGERRLCTIGHFNFVAVDENNRPLPVPKVSVQTPLEKQHWREGELVREAIDRRRQRVLELEAAKEI